MQSNGCQHYQRNCEVEAPCCLIYYKCKLCHDQQYKGVKANWCKTQRMQFSKVKNIRCLSCKTIQQPSLQCINCKVIFGKFACLKCKLYQNNPSKVQDIFHCDKCNMCRRGKAQQNKHCDRCGYCMNTSVFISHKCNQNNVDSNCPICLENLKFSVKYYQQLPCGHLIHTICLQEYLKSYNINCPTCGMFIQKMSKNDIKRIESMIQQTKDQLPPELKQKKVNVICNECLFKTMQAPFHFYGVKCQGCGTYNTKMI